MRLLLPLLALGTGFFAGLLVGGGDGERRTHVSPAEPGPAPGQVGTGGGSAAGRPAPGAPGSPEPLPRLLAAVRERPKGPAAQKRLAAFVLACRGRGADAIPELMRLLGGGGDVETQVRAGWIYQDGELKSYPTLRAACLEALHAIPDSRATDALREVLERTSSVEETYFIGRALRERGASGWVGFVLDRALGAEPRPILLPRRQEMVQLAAEVDPARTAARMETESPRGEDARDPMVLAAGLETMPLDTAQATVARLLDDSAVTLRAKKRFLESFGSRSEPEALTTLRELLEAGTLSGELRIDAAMRAVNSPGFWEDQRRYAEARARGDAGAAERSRARFRRRLEAARLVVDAAYGIEPGTSDDARARPALRRLELLARLMERS
ncbi:MAG: hypothetical protein ACE5JG_13590 [Planctomycetota bacterium]